MMSHFDSRDCKAAPVCGLFGSGSARILGGETAGRAKFAKICRPSDRRAEIAMACYCVIRVMREVGCSIGMCAARFA
jgi:hypothetical protein